MVFSGLIFSQNLPIIAVTEIQSSVDSKYWRDYKNSKSNNFQNMLETQLVKVGRFKIMERNRIDEAKEELKRAAEEEVYSAFAKMKEAELAEEKSKQREILKKLYFILIKPLK